ncbi:nicotinate-nucleotide adenylyltransferase [Paraglaciecola sp.]|nr:nicotinate-nucleotide adenylyltransferase [Paraglaciecola sp.]MDB4281661.1 nicotinate-nucleotide adenylyltransferase [Paraglaciecola sp.]
MQESPQLMALGLLGGSFNPVHFGHLRGAIEAMGLLNIEQLALMPAPEPPLKDLPLVSIAHRVAMLRLAIKEFPGLSLDTRELDRPGLNYTVDTLMALRTEHGPSVSLIFIMGADSLANLPRWSRWEQLLELANIAVITRPGAPVTHAEPVASWLAEHRCDAKMLRQQTAGGVALLDQTPLAISSSAIRADIHTGRSVRFLLPDAVIAYIAQHNLYRE